MSGLVCEEMAELAIVRFWSATIGDDKRAQPPMVSGHSHIKHEQKYQKLLMIMLLHNDRLFCMKHSIDKRLR